MGGYIMGVVLSRKARRNSGIGKCVLKKRTWPADWQMNVKLIICIHMIPSLNQLF